MTTRSTRRIREQLEAQVLRGDVYAPDCPSRALLDHVTSRWGVLVLVLLLEGPHRFGELSALVPGLSDKMLSQTLKTLTADGFITRVVSEDSPVRVTYHLDEAGRGVAERLADLIDWIETNVGELTKEPAR